MLFIGDCWLLESVRSSAGSVGQWVSGRRGQAESEEKKVQEDKGR